MVGSIEIAGQKIGPGNPCFIIAEAGVNHNGDINLAKRLIDFASESGANAVKFQTFDAENLVSGSAPKAEYQMETTSNSESQLEMLRRLELSSDEHQQLQSYCDTKKLIFLSSPFDQDSADFLENLGVPAFKVGSGEITNLPLLEHIAKKRKSIILSTGMSYLSEVEQAVQLIRKSGNQQIILLHCVSNYPTSPSDVNLRAMGTMATAFNVAVGFSDHTPGIEISLAASALDACVIEKHLTLDRNYPGPDHRSSLEPEEFTKLVNGIRNIEVALGHGRKEPTASEAKIAAVARRSLVASQDIPSGTKLSMDMIAVKRPGIGLPPAMMPYIVGRKAREDILADTIISLEMLA